MVLLQFVAVEHLGLLFALLGLLTRMAERDRCWPVVVRESLLAGWQRGIWAGRWSKRPS